MGKEKKHCYWCGGETKNPPSLISKISIIEEMEKRIDEIGRFEVYEDYYHGEIEADPIVKSEIYAYIDLLSDIKPRIICDECLAVDDELNDKYYSLMDENGWIIPFLEEDWGDDEDKIGDKYD